MTKFKKGLCIALAVIIGVVALGSVVTFAKNDTKKITPAFTQGSIDPSTGEHAEDNQSIYTEKVFECGGLRIEPDFDFKGTYDVFYYSSDNFMVGKAVGLTGVYKMNEGAYVGRYARIVIHPDVPTDYEGEDEWEIKFTDILKYASKLEIRVNKEGFKYRDFINLYNESEETLDVSYIQSDASVKYTPVVDYNSKASGVMELDEDYKTLEIVAKFKYPPAQGVAIIFLGEDGAEVSSMQNDLTRFENGIYHLNVTIPAGATHVVISTPKDATVFVYGIEK